MKKLKRNKFLFFVLSLSFSLFTNSTMAQGDSITTKEIVKLRYFNDNNNIQYLILESLLKTGKKTEPQKGKVFQVYLDSNKTENLIAILTTDKSGKAKCFLPTSLKAVWENSPQHKFIAVAAGKEEPAAELEITKAKIQIDTASSEAVRNITVQVMKLENSGWVPAQEVEMKIGIVRLGGILSAGDEETYTTDSSGTVTLAVTKDSLPGDQKGNIILAVKVEDNDLFGNFLIKKEVPWGVALKADKNFFDQRSLWATRFRSPIWLLFMVYSIVIAVWGTIIYLIWQIVKIKKLAGNSAFPKAA